ncbi:type I phosphomannose isomerase catalytic subunit [Butyrivibrio sp. MC2013]|uniref:type I phosphomannose isomerase catalytic subunit n=1 Tax=Butyrivibrio sp. MC2013 TaxID=1280686 RepID=UPI000422B280|nr:type I phosphomannose isomerase catalytic subunit [Butyrivibrio sp. MC2013]
MNDHLLMMTPLFDHKIWGGRRLRDEFGYEVEGDDIGECLGISGDSFGDTLVMTGVYKGKSLSELWNEHRELFGGIEGDKFPLLIKLIDAREDLSIQVHPDDSYAAEHENGSLGKTECWYILSCDKGASIVAGHNASTKEELRAMIDERRWNDLIRELPVAPGDFIQIDPGTIHAIKGGILLIETQQSSDITYRLYDYDRLSDGKLRPLHIDQSKDVIVVPSPDPEKTVVHDRDYKDGMVDLAAVSTNVLGLHKCDYYAVYRLDINGELCFTQDAPFVNMTVTEGEGEIACIPEGAEAADDDFMPLKKGDFFILTSGGYKCVIKGRMQIMASSVTVIESLENMDK